MGDTPCSIPPLQTVLRRRRPMITAHHDIDFEDIEDFAQQEMTKSSYSSYFGPFLAYLAKPSWTSKLYSQFFSSGPLKSSLQDPSLPSLSSNTKYGKYAPPQMLKITFETSSAKLGVGVVWAWSPGPWQINS